jgi:hypothetical protein
MLWPGKSEQHKARLAEKIAKDVMDVLNYGVSVGFGRNQIPRLEREDLPIQDKWRKALLETWIRDANDCNGQDT